MDALLRALPGVLSAVLVAAGCSSIGPSSEPRPEDLAGQLPQSAFVQGDALYILYRSR